MTFKMDQGLITLAYLCHEIAHKVFSLLTMLLLISLQGRNYAESNYYKSTEICLVSPCTRIALDFKQLRISLTVQQLFEQCIIISEK